MWNWLKNNPKPPGSSKEEVNLLLGAINAEQQTLSQKADSINESKQAHATISKGDSNTSVSLNPESMTTEQRLKMYCSDVKQ